MILMQKHNHLSIVILCCSINDLIYRKSYFSVLNGNEYNPIAISLNEQ